MLYIKLYKKQKKKKKKNIYIYDFHINPINFIDFCRNRSFCIENRQEFHIIPMNTLDFIVQTDVLK